MHSLSDYIILRCIKFGAGGTVLICRHRLADFHAEKEGDEFTVPLHYIKLYTVCGLPVGVLV